MAVQTLNQVQGDRALLDGFFALSCQPIKSARMTVPTLNQVQGDRALLDGFFVATYAAMEGRAAFRRNGAIAEPRNGGGAKAQAVELARHLNGRA